MLLHNTGNGLMYDRTNAIGPSMLGTKGGPSFADFDNDGDLDLFIRHGSVFFDGQDRLLRNDRSKFTDVTAAADLTGSQPTWQAIWLDYNRDGFLDLYVGHFRAFADEPDLRNTLWHNNGDGTFSDVTSESGLDLRLTQGGGAIGGMSAADFNGDGWPDLYVGASGSPNRLFLNTAQGGFEDATTSEIGDTGLAFGIAVGDIDNDGDLDIYQNAGGSGELGFRCTMLVNLGGGEFLRQLEGLGLTGLGDTNALGAKMADFDNDGDLDLLTATPLFLFLNDGDGQFTDRTELSGITEVNGDVAILDHDRDGFLDVAFTCRPFTDPANTHQGLGGLYRNNGNGNHYLRVELVGTISNRQGIGTRLAATSGSLRQVREILESTGDAQIETIAHFGLGQRTSVDSLEIRWTSGAKDVLRNIPADQTIRVIEGREQLHTAHPTEWEHNLPDAVTVGETLQITAQVRPSLFEGDARIARVTADLSQLGGAPDVALVETGTNSYELDMNLSVHAPTGWKEILIFIEQETAIGHHWIALPHTIHVTPAEPPEIDLPVFRDQLTDGWSIEGMKLALDLQADSLVYEGEAALSLTPEGVGEDYTWYEGSWRLDLRVAEPVDIAGYAALHMAFHPGDADETIVGPGDKVEMYMTLNGRENSRLGFRMGDSWLPLGTGMEMKNKKWQVLELPLDVFQLPETRLETITIRGNGLIGKVYLDDIRFVTGDSETAILEGHAAARPRTLTLSRNYPNPFNSSTTIQFALPQPETVSLTIYNLSGQQVTTFASGPREAGTHTLRWDARGEDGRELASGVYLYRLEVGEQVETRKLLLLR